MTGIPREKPACHVFTVGSDFYAYDLHSQQLLAVEPELAVVLRGERGSPAARAVLKRAQADENLFLTRKPRLIPRQPEDSVDVDQGLQHLVLTVTESCNLRCTYCLHGAPLDWIRSHGPARMDVETSLKAVAYFLDRRDPERAPVISFYGGEALLNLEVIESVVAAVRQHSHGADTVLAIDTNGVLLDESAIELVIREKVHLQISLDGPQPIHDRHRSAAGGQPTYAHIMNNIGRLLDRDPTVAQRLTFIVTLAPPVDLFAVADLFGAFPPYLDHGISQQPSVTVNFANLNNQRWNPDQEEAVGLPSVAVQVARARETYLDALAACDRQALSPIVRALFEPDLLRFHHRNREPLGSTYTPGANCRPGRRKLHVTVDGQLHPCERTGTVMPLGDIDSGIGAQKGLQERCGSCWVLRMCDVCLAAQAENAGPDGVVQPVPESVCQNVRTRKEQLLEMMVRILAMPPEARAWFDESELQ